MLSYARNNDAPLEYEQSLSSLTDLYRIRTAQCLLIADIAKPVKFTLETLTLYAMAEYSLERDGDMGTWLLSGTMMRVALQQGSPAFCMGLL
jgi:hypothetical protein